MCTKRASYIIQLILDRCYNSVEVLKFSSQVCDALYMSLSLVTDTQCISYYVDMHSRGTAHCTNFNSSLINLLHYL